MERRAWTVEEDNVLVELIEKRGLIRWATISKIMEYEFGIRGKSGKQCRERWFNNLNPTLKSGTWSPQQEEELFKLHRIHGNRWSDLARLIPQRSENCIKNHFYSTLRKGYRLISKYVKAFSKELSIKPFKNNIVNKIVRLSQLKVPNKFKATQQQIQRSINIIQGLISYALNQQLEEEKVREIIGNMTKLCSKVVRKNGKKRSKLFGKTYESEEESSQISTLSDINTEKIKTQQNNTAENPEKPYNLHSPSRTTELPIFNFHLLPYLCGYPMGEVKNQADEKAIKSENMKMCEEYTSMALKMIEGMMNGGLYCNQPN